MNIIIIQSGLYKFKSNNFSGTISKSVYGGFWHILVDFNFSKNTNFKTLSECKKYIKSL